MLTSKGSLRSRTIIKHPSLKVQVIVVLLTTASIVAVVMYAIWSYKAGRAVALEQFNQEQLVLARFGAAAIQTFFNEVFDALAETAKEPDVQEMSSECVRHMRRLYAGFIPRTSIRRVDERGNLRFIVPFKGWRAKILGANYAFEEFFETAKRTGGYVVSGPIVNERGQTRLRAVAPVYQTVAGDGDRKVFKGLLIASFDLDQLNEKFISPIVSGKTGYAWLLDNNGFFLAHYVREFVGRSAFEARPQRDGDISFESIHEIQKAMLSGESGTGRYTSGWHRERAGKIEKLIAYTPVHIADKTWSLAVCAPVDEVDAIIRSSAYHLLGGTCIVVIIILSGGSLVLFSYYRSTHLLEVEVGKRTEALRKTTDHLNTLIRNASSPIVITDPQGDVILTNKVFADLTGHTEEEVLGKPFFSFFPEEARSLFGRNQGSPEKEETEQSIEISMGSRPENMVTLLWKYTMICENDGLTPIGVVAQGQDITGQKRVEQALRRANRSLEMLSDCNQIIARANEEQPLLQEICEGIVRIGGYEAAWIGYPDPSAYGESVYRIACFPIDGEPVAAQTASRACQELAIDLAREAIETGRPCVSSSRGSDALGSEANAAQAETEGFSAAVSLPLILDDAVIGSLNIHASDRSNSVGPQELGLLLQLAGDLAFGIRSLRNKLRRIHEEKEKEKFISLVEQTSDLVGIGTREGRILYLNEAGRKLIGMDTREGSGPTAFADLFSESDLETFQGLILPAVQEEGCWKGELRVRHLQSGSPIPVEMNCFSVLDKERGHPEALAVLIRNISERKRAEADLRRAKEEWERTFDAIEDIVTILDPERRILRVNRAAEQALKAQPGQLIGKYCCEVSRGQTERCQGCPGIKTALDYQVHSSVIEHARLGKVFLVSTSPLFDATGKFEGIVHTAKDITEMRRLQTLLGQAQKMEAIGTLAGGIAHDFNNILGIITGNTELSLFDAPEGTPAYQHMTAVLKATNRAKALVKHILTFSRQSKQERRAVQPALIVKEALEMLRASLPSTIQIHRDIEKDSGIVSADPTEIHQIFLNLCTNAAHAMQEKGGYLRVSLTNVDIDAEEAERYRDLIPGPYVELTVSDTGHGMSLEVMDRIFDPYFTTKGPGEGTGLGLAVVYGIVKGYEGAIRVRSEPGRGSTFQVFLPRVAYLEDALEREEFGVLAGEKERILFVDDEKGLVDTGREMLERLGYQVVVRTSSVEALEAFRAHPDHFDLVLTDQTMPNMTGADLARGLMEIRPDIPIILCTGYSALINEAKAKEMGIRALLTKPLVMREAARAIREVLDGRERNRGASLANRGTLSSLHDAPASPAGEGPEQGR